MVPRWIWLVVNVCLIGKIQVFPQLGTLEFELVHTTAGPRAHAGFLLHRAGRARGGGTDGCYLWNGNIIAAGVDSNIESCRWMLLAIGGNIAQHA